MKYNLIVSAVRKKKLKTKLCLSTKVNFLIIFVLLVHLQQKKEMCTVYLKDLRCGTRGQVPAMAART